MCITYTDSISAGEVNAIRKAVGFRQNHLEQLQAELDGSALLAAAYAGDEAVGFASLTWNGGGAAAIPNVLVVPAYRDRGVEGELVSRLLTFLRGKLCPGYGIQVDVRAWGQQTELYESLGFQVSTPERRGVPMHICLTDQIELTDKMFGQMGYEKEDQ